MRNADLQHWPSASKYVCAKCVEDDALKLIVEDNLCSDECDYCGETSEEHIAAELSDVTEHMAICIAQQYTDPANELPYESKEGGYQGESLDAYDLFEDIGLYLEDDTLREDIISNFSGGFWCKIDYFLLDQTQRLVFGWRDFCNVVKHRRRFTFWSMGSASGDPEFPHPDDMAVGKMLDAIADSIDDAGLIRTLGTSEPIWRVRVHGASESVSTGKELGSPPIDYAKQANRMSPAGVSMFYGAGDFETAVAETLDPDYATGKTITGGMFHPARELNILDLHRLPPTPSFWNIDMHNLRDTIAFLYQFQADLSKPIERGKVADIEYVPTQAFSEYVRYHMQAGEDIPIDGISYTSSRNGQRCYVIFCDNEQCDVPEDDLAPEQILALDLTSLKSINAETVT